MEFKDDLNKAPSRLELLPFAGPGPPGGAFSQDRLRSGLRFRYETRKRNGSPAAKKLHRGARTPDHHATQRCRGCTVKENQNRRLPEALAHRLTVLTHEFDSSPIQWPHPGVTSFQTPKRRPHAGAPASQSRRGHRPHRLPRERPASAAAAAVCGPIPSRSRPRVKPNQAKPSGHAPRLDPACHTGVASAALTSRRRPARAGRR